MELADAVEVREPPIGASRPRNGAGDHDEQQEREQAGSRAGGGPHRGGSAVGSGRRNGDEDWSGEWDSASADGMTTGLTKQKRGGWRLEKWKGTAKGREVLETATGVWGRQWGGEDDRAAGRAPKGTEVGWGRDVTTSVKPFPLSFVFWERLWRLFLKT